MQTVKLHLNSVISDVNASYLIADMNFVYINTHMNRYENMRIPVEHIPHEFMEKCNLKRLIVNKHVLVKIYKHMYGLP